MVYKASLMDRVLGITIYTVLLLLSIFTLVPLAQVITVSLSPSEIIGKYGLHLFPTKFDFSGYSEVFHTQLVWRAYGNTLLRTVLGTTLTVLLTFMGAYPLSKKTLPNRKLWTGFIVLTMFFSGGMIPSYILIKNIGLMNSVWALVLPGAVSAFMLLIVRNFISGLPESLEESAKIDGANDIAILFKIVIPLSLPIVATVGLYTAVYHWNAWFDSMIYIQDQKKQVLQLVLRKILLEGQLQTMDTNAQQAAVNTESMKMATLLVAIIPIICVYPFLQKYFIKGSLVGSVKG
ncbi:carbohydrate ABC transporter permease [Paenibacillus aceris]|uniref:Aldouronate transport system permease protein n=1 Tax=Paenibacillus aceris TaxID=869555 RepID=A0ABS4HWR6_9BACL|nr:carbohydrate ABC transporter permease [Paenibacillus aceris]MBP1963078.1 putative aldouronate transport system permease protein [Paenibacillus aceris]NHW38801.1 carbohydrate ABC transporter permease [Paenibacillus aceris]